MAERPAAISETNRLAAEHSPYLLSAARQPVWWFPWGPEAFETAKRQDKPILLDIGAVWCHWCHVMDSESYERSEIAELVNRFFVAIKVDRDERPDVDSRYQSAVSAIAGQGGWPLTAFLKPDGQVFYGGTYFPPHDRGGRIGFPRLLTFLANAYRKERDKVDENARLVYESLASHLQSGVSPESLTDSLVEEATGFIRRLLDPRHGGFGNAPKFPHTSALQLLLARYDRSHEPWMLEAVRSTLDHMGGGGIYDQLAGGFHRYSTDERWVVPHFEKMLYDNAPLLSTYLQSFRATGDKFYREIAEGITRYVLETLYDKERGGFYASQDADVGEDDDGSYFTWSVEQAKQALDPQEYSVVQLHFGISESGDMPSDRSQNVLRVENTVEQIAVSTGMTEEAVSAMLKRAKEKMLTARSNRRTPFVDKTIYAGWNGTMVSAFLTAGNDLQDESLKEIAIRSLERILNEHTLPDGTISHRAVQYAPDRFLDDQVEIVRALLDAFESTTERRYLTHAVKLMDRTIEIFGDKELGGFFDLPPDQHVEGLLRVGNKPIQDSPVASANSVAIGVLNKLYSHTGKEKYREAARKSLEHFSGAAKHNGIFSAQYFLSLHEYLHPAPHVVIIAPPGDRRGQNLLQRALRDRRTGTSVSFFAPGSDRELPESVRAAAGRYSGPVAYVCSHDRCAPPSHDEESLASTLLQFDRG